MEELKNFNDKGTTVVIDEEGTVMGVLSNLDNLTQLIEEHWDIEVENILSVKVFDYGYKAEISLQVEEDGENYSREIQLISTVIY